MSLDNKVVNLADLKVSHDYLLEQDGLLSNRINELGSGIDGIQSQITALGNGSPIPVETVAEMTDNTKAYLYTGSEQGYTSGYWYTYDSTQAKFVPRGEYGAGVIIDSTLTVTGNAADAKATGDAIKAGKTFVVHVPGSAAVLSGSITAGDFAKALAAYTAGSGVYAVKDSEVYQLSAASSSTMTFTQMYHGTMNFIKQIQITSADTFTVTNTALSSSATDTSYSNTASGLTATNVQEAIDENAAALSNVNGRLGGKKTGTEFEWEIGSLNPGRGDITVSTTRIRSEFIPVTNGTHITLATPTSRLLVYCYDVNKLYVSDSPWLGYNEYTIDNVNVAYVRILIRKDTSNSTISDSEVEGLASGLTILYSVPIEVYTEFGSVVTDTEKLNASLGGTRNIEIESGSMNAGKPSVSTAYVRSKDFSAADVGDVFTVAPVGFGIYNSAIYIYTTDNESGYTQSVSIPATTTGKVWTYTFAEKCYFKFRASNEPSGANIKPEDFYLFNGVFTLSHLYSANELMGKVGTLAIDPSVINSEISGKFNIAVQTDTHMSKYVAYTGEKYNADNFNALNSVVNSVNTLDIDLFANLGDMIRGYQCDPDYESRATADAIMDCYKSINTNAAYVIGNHDDGCLFYSNGVYNDHKSNQQVMYPNEQFNRYTKYGLNNKGVSNYWYADIDGVRVIALYQRDFDYSQSVPGIEAFKIGSAQLDWLTNTALATTLPVIVLTHAPLVATLYSKSREGFDDVLSALTAFKSGGGKVIAVLSGHTHNQASATVNGITHIVFKNGYTFFELVSVDLSAGTITCKPIANSALNERSFTFS